MARAAAPEELRRPRAGRSRCGSARAAVRRPGRPRARVNDRDGLDSGRSAHADTRSAADRSGARRAARRRSRWLPCPRRAVRERLVNGDAVELRQECHHLIAEEDHAAGPFPVRQELARHASADALLRRTEERGHRRDVEHFAVESPAAARLACALRRWRRSQDVAPSSRMRSTRSASSRSSGRRSFRTAESVTG